MDDRSGTAERQLRDYPISLRQSARAVYGHAYERAEKRVLDGTAVEAGRGR